jgi:hypothetical protein
MKIKTNIRAGQGTNSNSATSSSSSTVDTSTKNQGGKAAPVVYTRCAGY